MLSNVKPIISRGRASQATPLALSDPSFHRVPPPYPTTPSHVRRCPSPSPPPCQGNLKDATQRRVCHHSPAPPPCGGGRGVMHTMKHTIKTAQAAPALHLPPHVDCWVHPTPTPAHRSPSSSMPPHAISPHCFVDKGGQGLLNCQDQSGQ
jgi:hypothetical protein